MGILDKIKDMMGGASKKAEVALGDITEKTGGLGGVAGKAGEVLGGAVDKAADAVDGATKGKFTDQIDKVRDLADKIDGEAGSATEAVSDAASEAVPEVASEAVPEVASDAKPPTPGA